jgi:methyl-accepting chemotaxis protein
MADKRKLLRIKNDFQQRLILQTLMLTFISINVIIIYLFLGPLDRADSPNEVIGLVIGILEIIAIAVVYRFSLVASHRIAGPVYVFERSLRQLSTGDLTQQMRLRNTDNFHESAEVFNATIEELRSRITHLQKLADNTLAALDEDAAGKSLEEISAVLKDLSEGLRFFRTELAVETGGDTAGDEVR